MTYADEIERRAKLLDPQYQQQLYMIEQAQKHASSTMPTAPGMYPDDFDEQFMKLIDSVPLE